MRVCEHCKAEPARPRSAFCSERCRGRARRRWARGLPADAVQSAGAPAALVREAARRDGERLFMPAKTIAEELRRLVELVGPDEARELVQSQVDEREAAA